MTDCAAHQRGARQRALIELPTPWLATSQKFWEKFVFMDNDSTFRDWFHVYAAAVARCKPNLHAEFASGELAKILGRIDPDGTLVPMAPNRLSNLINDCVQRGLLAYGSGQRCLSLPGDAFGCTLPGYQRPCPTCTKRMSKPRTGFALRGRSAEHKRESEYAQARVLPVHFDDVRATSPECMEVTA